MWADEVAALFVVAAILWSAYRLLRTSTSELMDEQADAELVHAIRVSAAATPGVRKIEKLRVRRSGMEYFADIHIEVDPQTTVEHGHEIGHDVKAKLVKELPRCAMCSSTSNPNRTAPNRRRTISRFTPATAQTRRSAIAGHPTFPKTTRPPSAAVRNGRRCLRINTPITPPAQSPASGTSRAQTRDSPPSARHKFEQRQQVLANLPRLALRSMPVSRRIENHRIVLVAALHFALAKLHRIFRYPPNRPIAKTRKHRILPRRSTKNAPHRCAQLPPRRRGRQRTPTRIRKQIQNPQRPPSVRLRFSRVTCRAIQSQFARCSGNTPTCPDGNASSCNSKRRLPSVHELPLGRHHCFEFGVHNPSPVRGPRNRAVAPAHNPGRDFATPSAAGQGRFRK